MLRFKIFASALPLVAWGALALMRQSLAPPPEPCLMLGGTALQIAATPWQAQLHVSFTDDPARATARVQTVDDAAGADFTVVDDGGNRGPQACTRTGTSRFVAIDTAPSLSGPVIYLTSQGPADYRIFVQSKTFSAREAAALVVGAHQHAFPVAAAL